MLALLELGTAESPANLGGVSDAALFWTGVAFAGFLVIVFTVIALRGPSNFGPAQYQTLRVLAMVFTGAASGFITGGALVRFEVGSPGNQILAVGTAGFAMAILVWWQFPPYAPSPPPPPPPFGGAALSPVPGTTFRQAIDGLASGEDAVAVFSGFEPNELAAVLQPRRIAAATTEQVMELVGGITQSPDAVRPYRVTRSPGRFNVERK